VGCVCRTEVMRKTPVAESIREALAHPFGVGNSLFRTGISQVTEVDTVPFGCFKKDVFIRFGLFDERLIRNQDIELNKRIKKGGGRIFLIPDVFCTYFARDTYADFMKSNYSNGFWNILTVYLTGSIGSLSVRHFVPLAFTLSLGIPILLTPVAWQSLYLLCASIVPYSLLITYVSLLLVRKGKVKFLPMVCSFFLLHISYGFGSLAGMLSVFGRLLNRGKA
jgi:hypothetical protein